MMSLTAHKEHLSNKDDSCDSTLQGTNLSDNLSSPNSTVEENTFPVPNIEVCRIYTKATPSIARLIDNPKDTEARNHLAELNMQIQKLNLRNKYPQERQDDFCIEIEWFEQIPFYCRGYPGLYTKTGYKSLPDMWMGIIEDYLRPRHYPVEWSRAFWRCCNGKSALQGLNQ
jgi:hypothetical protein